MANSENKIVLLDESGKEYEFQVIDMLEVDEEEYAILLPVEEGEQGNEAIILKVGVDENGDDILYEIESDDEWEMVAKAWQDSIDNRGGLQ